MVMKLEKCSNSEVPSKKKVIWGALTFANTCDQSFVLDIYLAVVWKIDLTAPLYIREDYLELAKNQIRDDKLSKISGKNRNTTQIHNNVGWELLRVSKKEYI